MSKKYSQIFIYLFFLAIGFGLTFLVIRNPQFDLVLKKIGSAKWEWIVIVVAVSFFAHILRAIRWKMLIQANGSTPSFAYTYHSMMFGYFVNLVIPRLGELSRCAALKRRNRISFNITFGTVITDKLLDMVVLMTTIALVFATQYSDLKIVFTDKIYEHCGGEKESNLIKYILLGIVGLVVLIWVIMKLLNSGPSKKVDRFFRQVYRGIISIKKVKNRFKLVWLTISIWVCYFLMSYLCFFAVEETSDIGPLIAINLLAIGGVGRALPIPMGGAGAYHCLVGSTLIYMCGLDYSAGFGLAVIIHGLQTLFYIVFGGVSTLVIFRLKALPKQLN